MVECLVSYYCVSLVPRPIDRVESIVVIISVTLKSSRSSVVSDANRCCWLTVRCCRGAASRSILCSLPLHLDLIRLDSCLVRVYTCTRSRRGARPDSVIAGFTAECLRRILTYVPNQQWSPTSNSTLGVYAHAQLLISATPPHLSDYQFYSYTRYIHSNTTYESASVYKEIRVEK